MKKIIATLVAFFALSPAAFAEGFNLNSVSAGDLDFGSPAIDAPRPVRDFAGIKSPALSAPVLDLTLKLTFRDINERLAQIEGVTVNEKNAPIMAKEGGHIIFTNVTVNVNGIEVEPTIRIKPWFEGKNRLALKFAKIEMDAVFGPSKSMAFPDLDKDEVMNFVVKKITGAMLAKMNAALAINKVNVKAEDLISFRYDKAAWVLRADMSPKFIAPLMPGLLDDINLTSFGFDEKGFALSVHSGTDIRRVKGYNLALSDGLLTNFVGKYSAGSQFNLVPEGHDGGIKFRADGKAEISGMTTVKVLLFDSDVYFTAVINPAVTAPNTLRIVLEDVKGEGFTGVIIKLIKKKIIKSAVKSITENPELAKVMKARKINDETVELKIKNKAFLPSFARGVSINKMKISRGLMFVGFNF